MPGFLSFWDFVGISWRRVMKWVLIKDLQIKQGNWLKDFIQKHNLHWNGTTKGNSHEVTKSQTNTKVKRSVLWVVSCSCKELLRVAIQRYSFFKSSYPALAGFNIFLLPLCFLETTSRTQAKWMPTRSTVVSFKRFKYRTLKNRKSKPMSLSCAQEHWSDGCNVGDDVMLSWVKSSGMMEKCHPQTSIAIVTVSLFVSRRWSVRIFKNLYS